VSSRKEQKERLRQERLQREQEAKAAQRRKQLVGYGVGGALALAAVVVVAVLLLAGGDDGASGSSSADIYPSGVEISDPGELSTDVEAAADAAGCELESNRGKSRDHTEDPNETLTYEQNPPNSGKHFAINADDGIYDEAPDKEDLVHTLEHGRVIIWFDPKLPAQERGALRTLFEEDNHQLVLTPNQTGMPYAVAATAWNGDPQPLGTGRTLGCPRYNEKVLDALRAFRDEHRGNGPEAVP
jgi:hypothetical protein